MIGTPDQLPPLPEPPPHVLDEDAVERRQIRAMLVMTPAQRLDSLRNAYQLHRARITRLAPEPRKQALDEQS